MGITSLLLPIFLSSVFVFFASYIIHALFKYHANDFRQLPGEDEAMDALRKLNIPPGDYAMPRAGSMAAHKDPAYLEKYKKGPLAFITVFKGEKPTMGKELLLWFIYCLVVGVCAAYISSRALAPGSPYLMVHRFAGATAFFCYSLALLQNSIWYKRSWSSTLKSMFDGLIYALITGGTFGWLWPEA